MIHTNILPTTRGDIPALQIVLDKTQLFPADLLPAMIAPVLVGESDAIWLTCHVNGNAVALCYPDPRNLTTEK